MLGVWIGAIQNMYPELGAGVEGPLHPAARAIAAGRALGVSDHGAWSTTATRAAQTGHQIKSYHKTIKGIDGEGRR